MSFSTSDLVTSILVGGLGGMKAHLAKAVAHADAKGLDHRELLDARLAPDMFTLTQQVQSATDTARRGVARIIGNEPTSVADDEKTFDELTARIDATIAYVSGIDKALLDESETRSFTVNFGQDMPFTGRTYLLGFMVPNFLFHATTLYGILRHKGVELGKRDFIAPILMSAK